MQINNNYATIQPSFGKLKAVHLGGRFSGRTDDLALDVLKTFKKSEAFTNFCNKYDVRATFNSKYREYCSFLGTTLKANASLKLEVKEIANGFFENVKNYFKNPAELEIIKFDENEYFALKSIKRTIEETSYSDLEEMYLDKITEKSRNAQREEKMQKEFDKTINSLLKD